MLRILKVDRDLDWLPPPNECYTVLAGDFPPRELMTSVHAFAFQGDRLLMTRLADRGWDIPGGHIEPGEEPLAALLREAYEETRARLGHVFILAHKLLRLLGEAPRSYRYPYPQSYQLFYCANVQSLEPFVSDEERTQRGLVTPEEARGVPWIQRNRELYEAALQAQKSVR